MNCQDRAFIMYSQILGIAHHPRAVEKAAYKEGAVPLLTPRQAANRTLEAMDEFRQSFGRCDDQRCRWCYTG